MPAVHYHKHYANDADELGRYGFFKKSKARVTKHDDQSKEHHHEGANLDQSCRSTKIICYLKKDQSDFLEERRQKDLVNEFASLTTSESMSRYSGYNPTMCGMV